MCQRTGKSHAVWAGYKATLRGSFTGRRMWQPASGATHISRKTRISAALLSALEIREPEGLTNVMKGNGGERGIRTLGTLARSTVFETAPFDHSGTSPQGPPCLLAARNIHRGAHGRKAPPSHFTCQITFFASPGSKAAQTVAGSPLAFPKILWGSAIRKPADGTPECGGAGSGKPRRALPPDS